MKPEFPLPWKVVQPPHDPRAWDVATENGGAFAKLVWHGAKENAAYIVHACNAYPRLVAELKRLCVEIPAQMGGKPVSNALLRDLGELE